MRLVKCTKFLCSVWRLMNVEVFAQDLVVGILLKTIAHKWLHIMFPRREAMMAGKDKKVQVARHGSMSI